MKRAVVSIWLFSVWFHYFFKVHFNKSYLMSVPKIVKITHAINYIRDFPRNDFARFICTSNTTTMSSWSEPMIWSCDTGQLQLIGSCQLIITWMTNIKDVPMVIVSPSYFSRYVAWCTEICTCALTVTWPPKFLTSMRCQIFLCSGVLFMCLWCTGNLLTVSVGAK